MGEIKYGRTFTFHMSPGETSTYGVEGCKTVEDANYCLARVLYHGGYRPPKWFEWWRFSERRLPPEVKKHFDGMRSNELSGEAR